ncbi:hypothetical protein ACFYRN_28820 [Streptomyces sp. NPDC005227]|uniref:hypothetical protein n=1 Tax=Streptomyces sp. NPDC005227 TaxID=3364707 RepID=UPI00369218F0
MGKLSNFILGTPEQRDHNATFNHRDTDPNSSAYLASHDRVVKAEKAAKSKKR